ncbi:MAG: DUF4263 domain-containing protein [Flavobacteriaceae bacterium]|nr:DUF4263 domain-containing protein [Flavobacteriaceae bacterium]
MTSDIKYLQNYKADYLYINKSAKGKYATIVTEEEFLVGEVEVTERSRLVVKAFYVDEKEDYGSFQIIRINYHKSYGWREESKVSINQFDALKMKSFVSIFARLNLRNSSKARLSLKQVEIEELEELLKSSAGSDIIKKLANSPELHQDIYAITAKKKALSIFKNMLSQTHTELEWQKFFEENKWIFGYGLNYIFLNSVSNKLEARTTGAEFNKSGKTTDALMKTRAEVSQYVLVEIKKNDTELLQSKEYRSGCFAVSTELSGAVTQAQKTVFEFSKERFRDYDVDEEGNDLNSSTFAINPQSYLVIGNLSQIRSNKDKVTCFELYRKNINSPVIITFDELYYRARCIVDNLSNE